MQWFDQLLEQLSRLWIYLTTGRVLAIVLGVLFALVAIALLIASRTRWGRAKPLTKFVVISVLLHVWLLMYAVSNRKILPQGDPNAVEQNISVSFDDTALAIPSLAEESPANEARPAIDPHLAPADLDMPPEMTGLDLDQLQPAPLLPDFELTPMPPLPPLPPEEALADEQQPEETSPESSFQDRVTEVASTAVDVQDSLPTTSKSDEPPDQNHAPEIAGIASTTEPEVKTSEAKTFVPDHELPEDYQLRQSADRLRLSEAFGADADSEAAVEAGLAWLAQAQSPDGAWIAADYGAGTETYALDEYRHGTGGQADTAISGLALLAFLSAGHTHLDGPYSDHVRRGLSYLIGSQMPSGDMSGPKQVGSDPSVLNSRMYCHSMASLAIAEAYAMTGDPALKPSVTKAARYSIRAQDVRGGGWRYLPGDKGDLSQFGWQAMALRSVERSGISIPIEVKRRMRRFLDSCAAGRSGGLARYKPREGRPSNTMTAEALACRLLLDYPISPAALQEAKSLILSTRPGVNEDNVYFWYYATLALFQLQDQDWRAWNQALKAKLLSTQIPPYGEEPGSWDPDRMWGGYGGRVYSTAMSCLCLEVYYRYLPMYGGSNVAHQTPDSRWLR